MLRKVLITASGLFLLLALFVSAFGFAQNVSAQITEGDDSAVPAEEGTGRRGKHRRGGRNILTSEERAEVVADVLGISAEEVTAAKEDGTHMSELAEANGVSADAVSDAIYAASSSKVDEMVASGDLTAEQGEQILARLELRQLARQVIDKDELKQVAASTLGVSVEELEAAKEDGTMEELLESSGVRADELAEAVTAARDEMIDDAVTSGDLTAEQAEQLKARTGKHKGAGCEGRGDREDGFFDGNSDVEASDA